MWVASAQLVGNMVSSHVHEQLEDPVTFQSKSIALLEFPLYTWGLSDSPEKRDPICRGVLQLSIQGLSDDEIFWFLVQEYQALLSRIMKQQPEPEGLTPNSCHELFIYSCIRAVLPKNTFLRPTISESYEVESGVAIQLLGSRQLLRAIQSVKLAADGKDSRYELPSPIRRQMTSVAISAFEAETIQSPIQDASIEEKKVEIKQLVEFESWAYGPDYDIFRVVQASGSISRGLKPVRREEISALEANLAGNDQLSLARALVEESMESTPTWMAQPYSVSKWRLAMIGVSRILIVAMVAVSLFLPLLVPAAVRGTGIGVGTVLGQALLHLTGHLVLIPRLGAALMMASLCFIYLPLSSSWFPYSGLTFWFIPFLFGTWETNNYAFVRRKLLQCYPRRWFYDKFDLREPKTSAAITYRPIIVKGVSRLYHLLALYYIPSKLKLVTLPNPAAIGLRYSDVQSQLEENLDLLQALDCQVWSLMSPWAWHSRDDNLPYLGERLTLKLANLQLIIVQMQVLSVELRLGGDDILSEDALVAAVHREVKKLTARRKKLEREVEEMSRISQSSNTAQ
jgi:hypothetical protein